MEPRGLMGALIVSPELSKEEQGKVQICKKKTTKQIKVGKNDFKFILTERNLNWDDLRGAGTGTESERYNVQICVCVFVCRGVGVVVLCCVFME